MITKENSKTARDKINVLVVDGDYMKREKVSGILSRHEKIGCVTQASSCENAQKYLKNITPDIAFIDASCYSMTMEKSSCQFQLMSTPVVIMLDDGEMNVSVIKNRYFPLNCVEKRLISEQIDILLAVSIEFPYDEFHSAEGKIK